MAFNPETSGWARQLLTIMTIFLPCSSILQSSSRNHSTKNAPYGHIFLSLTATREITYMFEASRFGRFSDNKHWNFLTKAVRCSHPSYPHFAVFSTSAILTSKMKRFRWMCFSKQTKLICIKNILQLVSSQYCGQVRLFARGSHLFRNLFRIPGHFLESDIMSKTKSLKTYF